MAHIDMFIQVGKFPSDQDRRLVVPLPQEMVRQTFAPIYLPSRRVDAVVRETLCTPSAKIAATKINREEAAEMLSEAVTKALLESMGYKDTRRGYTREQDEEFCHPEGK